jgi:Holliday junction DNA helicase RuvB
MGIGTYAEMVSRDVRPMVVCDERTEYRAGARAESASGRESMRSARVRFEMTEGLVAREVDREIGRGRRAGDIGHRVVAFYLADCADRGLHQAFGHSSVIPYAVKRHGLSRRRARDLIVAGRALRELRKIDRAFLAGELFWSQVRVLAKVADATTEDAWLAFARAHTIDELEREAALAKKGEAPRADRKGLSEARFNLSLKVSALLHEQYALARQKVSAEAGHAVSDEEFAGALLESLLRGGGSTAHSSDSLYRVVVDMTPEGSAAIRSEDGPIPIDAATAEAIACDAGILAPDGTASSGHAPPISDALRSRILARDGYRCVVCGSRFQLHVHHVVFRSRGGRNAWSNLMSACKRCHTLVHGGFLSITGTAPRALVMRDRNGDLLADPARAVADAAHVGLEIAPSEAPEVAHGGPLNSGNCAEKLGVSEPRLPAEIDAGWLERRRHLLSWDAARTALRLGEGVPVEPEAQPEFGEAPAGPAATPSPLRPTSLDEVVGQREAVRWLELSAEASLRTGRMPTPLLLLGQGGLGKTTLAGGLAHALGSRLKTIDCSTVEDPMTLIGHLFDLRARDVLFFDEVHALPPRLAESVYQALEDGIINLPFADGIRTRSVRLRLPPVAFVAATTSPERMPPPLLSRFRSLQLEPYSAEELAEIVRRASKRDGIDVAAEALGVIAAASSGNARAAIDLYTGMRTLVEARGRTSATADDARAALEALGLDARGWGRVHHRILEALAHHGRPLAVRRLAAWVGVTLEAFRRFYEPGLLMSGAMVATPRGMALGRG